MQNRSAAVARCGIIAAGVLLAAMAVAGCTRENVCYRPEEMPEFGKILRAVPCEKTTTAPEAERGY